MNSWIVVNGWRAPSRWRSHGRVTSTRLLDQDTGIALDLEFGLTSLERRLDLGPHPADPLAGRRLRRGRQGADLAIGQRERRTIAGMGEPGGLQLVQVGCLGNRLERIVEARLQRVRRKGVRLDRVVAHRSPRCCAGWRDESRVAPLDACTE